MNVLHVHMLRANDDAPASFTARAETTCPAPMHSLGLEFLVSKNEEYVRMHAIRGRLAFDLGSRNHNYLLLTLARRRLSDTADGLSESEAGWIHVEELAHDPSMSPPRLNLDIFRVRKQFAALGFADATSIVERRVGAREIRIGTRRLAVRPA